MPNDRLDILPYVYDNGSWSATDSFIKNLFIGAYKAGYHETVFCEAPFQDPSAFVNYLQGPRAAGYILFWDGEVCCMIWLDTFGKRSAELHYFPVDPQKFRDPVKVAKGFTEFAFNLKAGDGETPIFDVLTGKTLEDNIKARVLLRAAGWKEAGLIPQGIFSQIKGESVPAVISYITRR